MGGSSVDRDKITRQLRQQLGRWQTVLPVAGPLTESSFSTGVAPLDRLLPGGGLRHGMLVEWLSKGPASGAAMLSLIAAREAAEQGGIVVVIDRRQMFYPPAAAAWGIDLDRLVVVHPRSTLEELWAAVQALRSPVVAAVWAAIHQIDDRAFRRLQLAAEVGRTLGLLLRPAAARGQPSWADVRLLAKLARQGEHHDQFASLSFSVCRVEVYMLRCPGGLSDKSFFLEIDITAHTIRETNPEGSRFIRFPGATNHDTHSLSVVSELADPATRPFSAGA
jgi:hypothetical protein